MSEYPSPNADPLGRSIVPQTDSHNGLKPSEPENAADLYRLLKDYPKLDLEAVGLGGADPNKL